MEPLVKKILKKLEAFNFFQIEVIADFEYEGKIYKNHKQYNNDSILNSNNWELHKETFFNQRMNFYKESYTLSEKIKLEIEAIENLTINETDYKILKDRYKSFLLNKQNPPQQVENVKPDEVKKELYNHIFRNNAIEVFQSMFDSFGITENSRTDVKFIFEEMKKDGLIQKTVNQKTFLDWLSEPPYQISVQKTSNYSKTHKRNSIYSTAKQLYKT
jgi:hypothetical protein